MRLTSISITSKGKATELVGFTKGAFKQVMATDLSISLYLSLSLFLARTK